MASDILKALGEELHRACCKGDLDAIKTFISSQTTVHQSFNPPWQALLHAASGADQARIVQYCLDNHAHVTNEDMRIVLINRAKETYNLLLDARAIDVDYYIPWFGDILGNVAIEDDQEWTALCLRHGANPNRNLVDEHKSVLAAVAELASVETAKLLVEGGASVRGSGAIVMAAEEGRLNMVEFMLDHGADVDEIGIEHPTDERYKEDMGTALHKAAGAGHEDVARFLIDNGARLDIRDPLGRTPMALAQAEGKERMVKLLKVNEAAE
ncbi:MAG: hypothetical protein LQ350_004130 [Teloschistes chrysophthalmus]|nr:MAG: hypothetical protein LQ350_004130 [Niorma chrysophthalma]